MFVSDISGWPQGKCLAFFVTGKSQDENPDCDFSLAKCPFLNYSIQFKFKINK